MKIQRAIVTVFVAVAAATLWLFVERAIAHCDTMDGPIVPEAQRALDSGDVEPLLKWVQDQDEPAIRAAFDRARAVRDLGPEARKMADQFFLETLIRIHRAGEGEPFTGLKPAGSAPPIFKAADEALDARSVDALADELARAIRSELKTRFDAALQSRVRMNDSVEAGRAYVQDYISYMHFVEGLHEFIAHGPAKHHADSGNQVNRTHSQEQHK